LAQPWSPLLDWWFGMGQTAAQVAADKHGLWFGYREAQDAEARERFGDLTAEALAGGLQAWVETAEGWLALILLLDQLPRMIHRGTPRAFAGDARASVLLDRGLALGFDRQLVPIRQVFAFLVLEHAEDPQRQEQSLLRFTALENAAEDGERELFQGFLDYAVRHREVIRRFGRFPHRNAILGRPSSADELAFLREPGSRF
jgi:uncharacterized protein (DUF924 family)